MRTSRDAKRAGEWQSHDNKRCTKFTDYSLSFSVVWAFYDVKVKTVLEFRLVLLIDRHIEVFHFLVSVIQALPVTVDLYAQVYNNIMRVKKAIFSCDFYCDLSGDFSSISNHTCNYWRFRGKLISIS